MAVDKELFTEYLAALAEYYNRKMPLPITKAWYKAVGLHLTTEQFVEAFEATVVNQKYMPTPKEFLEAVASKLEPLALKEWETCLVAACRGDREAVSNLSEAGKIALRDVGGIHGLGQSLEVDQPKLQKKFINAWKSTSIDQQRPVLPPAQDTVVLPPAEIQALADKLSMNGNGKQA